MKNDAEKTEVKKGSSLVIIFKNSDGKETRMSVQAFCQTAGTPDTRIRQAPHL